MGQGSDDGRGRFQSVQGSSASAQLAIIPENRTGLTSCPPLFASCPPTLASCPPATFRTPAR